MRPKTEQTCAAVAGLILALFLEVGCSTPPPAATVEASPEPPTSTTVPTLTPSPTSAPTPTSTPVSKAITADNAANLAVLRVINVSNDAVTAVAFSPVDHKVATFGFDKVLRTYDADSGDLVRQMMAHGDWGIGLAYSPDGSKLASAGRGGDIILWDTATGQVIRKLVGSAHRIYSLDWARDGSKFAVGGDFSSTVNIFSSAGQKLKDIKLPGGWAWSVAWSNDYLAISNDSTHTIYVYDANNYTLVQELAHGGNPSGELDFSPDGSLLVGCQRDPKMYIWETADWKLRASFDAHPKQGNEQGCLGGDFSKNGEVYFSGGDDGYLNAWNTADGALLKPFNAHIMVWSVSVSGDGELVAAGLADGTLRIMGLKSSQQTSSQPGALKIVSSLPMTGASVTQTQAIVNAEKLRLEQANGQACGGKVKLTYEAWDDASAALGRWDPAVETENANKAAADKSIIAYLGTFNSGAAKLSIPILNRAGPLVMVSPANTYPGLTRPGGGVAGEPEKYYPMGLRNYARLTTADDVQGAVGARFIKNELGANTVFVLDDGDLYGSVLANAFADEAASVGLTLVGRKTFDPTSSDYKALMKQIATSNSGNPPDAIYVSTVVDNNAAQLIKDKVAILGDQSKVKVVGPDGIQTQRFIDGAGANIAEGVYASVAGLPFEKLPAAAQQFKKDYDKKYGGDLNEPYAAYGYETMNVVLKAIEDFCASGGDPGDRAAVNKAVFAIKDFSGVLGTWSFDANGDTTLTDMTFYVVRGGQYAYYGLFK